ncbi:HMG domain-containing protein 3-like [Sinocyclocheilus grahami]|uniref:HMG domain-containing protein 3-like n=1 Tax=Sinocyclocheilus grahami TaxID=75366 RepID=UPI0007AD699A|nr:PREDICTED: HMG domain-containing protein 3-like [Sinocyclocheilus grahami]
MLKKGAMSWDPSVLVRLIHEGLIPDQMDLHSEEELRDVLEKCGIPAATHSDKSGLWTAGRVSKVCPHQVVCGAKYIVCRESARDHLDLLVSSWFWPPVYVADCAQKVALFTDVLYPELASQMWGKNQGCISEPTTPPQYVSCSELQDQPYSLDLTATESNPHLHPLTKSASRWIM